MECSTSIALLADALSKAQAIMEHAEKDRINPHFKNKYATLASVWDAIRAPLTANGLSVIQPINADATGVTVRTVIMHKSGEYVESALTMTGPQANPQQLGSLISYARRYALTSMLGVCADEDDDGHATRPAPTVVKEPAHAPTPPRPQAPNQEAPGKDAAPAAAQAAPRLTDTQRWNVATALMKKKLGDASAAKMIAEISAKYTPAGATKVPDDQRAAMIAELEKAARGDST